MRLKQAILWNYFRCACELAWQNAVGVQTAKRYSQVPNVLINNKQTQQFKTFQ